MDLFVEALTYNAERDQVTGREVYPVWVVYVLASTITSVTWSFSATSRATPSASRIGPAATSATRSSGSYEERES